MLDIILPVFGVMLVGFLARFFNVLGENANPVINDYIYYISMPFLIFSKIYSVRLGIEHLMLVLANAIPILISISIVVSLWKLKILHQELAALLVITSFFGNIIYLGFPLIELRFGSEALATASIISFVYNVFLFGIGIALVSFFSRRKPAGEGKISSNTLILSCILGALFSFSGISLPDALIKAISAIGSTTAPLALFSIGAFLYGKSLSSPPSKLFLVCFFKMLVFPVIFIAVSSIFGLSGELFEISFLEALMPVAVTNFVIAQKFKLDSKLVADSIIISTLFFVLVLAGFDFMLGLLI
ncbi:MAG: AEC family transporter [Candidatus Micrarchaeota archaeon]|nr:AEC family transporter [Candidatus Micrarchaeota archaeon]